MPPDQSVKVRPHNLELTIAIAYTKAEQYDQADNYASLALSNLEAQINKNKGLAFASLSKQNASAANLIMTSYCLTLHHLGNIKAKLGDFDHAVELLTKAKVLAPKYVKEKEIRTAIAANLKACEDIQNNVDNPHKKSSIRKTTSEPQLEVPPRPISRPMNGSLPSTETLVEEILADHSGVKRKRAAKKTSNQSILKTPSPLPNLLTVQPTVTSQRQFVTLDAPPVLNDTSISAASEEGDIVRVSKGRIMMKTTRSQRHSRDWSAVLDSQKDLQDHPVPQTKPVFTGVKILKAEESVRSKDSGDLPPPTKVQIHKEMQRLREIEKNAAQVIKKHLKKYIERRRAKAPPVAPQESDPEDNPSQSMSVQDLQSEASQDLDLLIASKDLFPLSQVTQQVSEKFSSSEEKESSENRREILPGVSALPSYRTIPIHLARKQPPGSQLKEIKSNVKIMTSQLLDSEDESMQIGTFREEVVQNTPQKSMAKVRRRATPRDFLSLTAPPIFIRKRLKPESFPYNWKLSLQEMTCNRTVIFHLVCVGEGLSLADNIHSELPVEVDLEQLSDYRIMFPFEYETVWPVVAGGLETVGTESEDLSRKEQERGNLGIESSGQWQSGYSSNQSVSFADLDDSNRDEAASDRIRFTLENILDRYELTMKTTGKVLGPMTTSPQEILEKVRKPELPDLRDLKDGVFKQLVFLAVHNSEAIGQAVGLTSEVYTSVQDTIFERGIAKLELGYFFIVLTMTSDFKVLEEGLQTNYNSYVLLELQSTTSDWKEMLPISWESIEIFYQTIGYSLSLDYVLSHRRLPLQARSLLYQHIPTILQIHMSSISIDFSRLSRVTQVYIEELSDEDLFATSACKPVIVTDVNWIEQEEAVNWDLVLPGSVYTTGFTIEDYTKRLQEDEAVLILNRTKLQGGKDMLHIKVSFTQSHRLSIDAWTMRTEDCYRLIQNNEELIKFLVRLCEENEACGRLILQSTVRLERTMHGTMLISKQRIGVEKDMLRELMCQRLEFLNREIRTISNILCIVCFYSSDRGMRLEVYNHNSGRVYIVALSSSDFEEYFRDLSLLVPGIKKMLLGRESIHAPIAEAIREFFWPLSQQLVFERCLTGQRLIWAMEPERLKDEALRVKNAKISGKQFQFLEKTQTLPSKTIKMRALGDSIINSLLGYEADGLLIHSNNEFRVVLQRTKLVRGHLGVLSVLRHTMIEEWRIHLYLPSTCRSFQSRLYDSDLYSISAEALDVPYPDPNHIVNAAKPQWKAWELILSQCTFEVMRGMIFFQFDNISSPMVEVLYSAIIEKNYSAGETSGVLYAEVVVKPGKDVAGPFDDFPVLHDLKEAKTKLMLSIRAYAFSKRIWVKQNLTLDEGVRLLLREHKLDQSVLVQSKFTFCFVRELSNLLFKVVKLKAKVRSTSKDISLPDITAIARSRDQTLDPMVGKDDWRNIDESITEKEERLHLTIVHSIPVTLGGAFFNVYRDEFVIRVYRPSTGESYKKVVRRKEMRNLIAEVDFLLEKGLHQSLGVRIIQLLMPRVLSKISLST